MPLLGTHQQVLLASAGIEEIVPVPPGSTLRSESHPTFQRNDSNSNCQSQRLVQSEAPWSTNASYKQFFNHSDISAQSTTFISNDVGPIEVLFG